VTLKELAEKRLEELREAAGKVADKVVRYEKKLEEINEEIELLEQAIRAEEVSD
jgi:flagellar biosynthesis chaperone FliJ